MIFDKGAKYDAEGNIRNWWQNKTEKEFNKRTKCFEEQYSAFHEGNQTLSGEKTLGNERSIDTPY